MEPNRNYQVGDLLVKKRGKTSIQLIIKVNYYGVNNSIIKLLDMETKQERSYTSTDISGWLFYIHYPVVK